MNMTADILTSYYTMVGFRVGGCPALGDGESLGFNARMQSMAWSFRLRNLLSVFRV